MDLILKVLQELRQTLIQKRKSLQGTVEQQRTREGLDAIESRICKLTEKINEVNDCITLRMSETGAKAKAHHVSLD